MITITERKATEEEIAEKKRFIEHIKKDDPQFKMIRLDLMLIFAGTFFLLILVIILITVIFPTDSILNYLYSSKSPVKFLTFISIFYFPMSVLMILHCKMKLNKEKQKYIEQHLVDLECCKIEVKTISNIQETWKIIDNVDHFGVACHYFIFTTTENEYFSFYTYEKSVFFPQEEKLIINFISEEISFEKWADTGQHLKITTNGEEIPKSGNIHIEQIIHMIDENSKDEYSLHQFPEDMTETIQKHATKEYE
jgi:hypothetical protein